VSLAIRRTETRRSHQWAALTGDYHRTIIHQIRETDSEARLTSTVNPISSTVNSDMNMNISTRTPTTTIDRRKSTVARRGIIWLLTRSCWPGQVMGTL
jgi:hypothetical protein